VLHHDACSLGRCTWTASDELRIEIATSIEGTTTAKVKPASAV
jgi:hypothetical protein